LPESYIFIEEVGEGRNYLEEVSLEGMIILNEWNVTVGTVYI
jgi:hypothetical protein